VQLLFCPSCHASISSSASYCNTCGAVVPAVSAQPTVMTPPPPPLTATQRADATSYDDYAAQYGSQSGPSYLAYPQSGPSPSGAFADTPHYSAPFAQPVVLQQPVFPIVLKQKRSGFALASVILGSVGILFAILLLLVEAGIAVERADTLSTDLVALLITLMIFCIPAILAVVFGHLARGDIQRQAGRLTGMGASIAGLVLGYLSIGLPLIGLSLFLLARL
jgi:hypothetical protein